MTHRGTLWIRNLIPAGRAPSWACFPLKSTIPVEVDGVYILPSTFTLDIRCRVAGATGSMGRVRFGMPGGQSNRPGPSDEGSDLRGE